MNTKNLAAALLPVVFAVASFGTVGCSAEAETSGDVASRETPAAASPVEALAGSATVEKAAAPAPATDARAATTAPTLRLSVTQGTAKPVTYDVLSFDFGVDTQTSFGSAATGALSAKPTLRPLNVVVRPSSKTAVLQQNLYGSVQLTKVVLQRVDAAGVVTDFAQFDKPVVSKLATDAGDEAKETYEIQALAVTAKEGGTSVTVDIAKGTTTVIGKGCLASNPGQLGPYTQSGLLGTVAKDSTRVDSLSVELHNATSLSTATAGASAGKAVLDGITFERDVETSGLCAMYLAGTGNHVNDLRVGIAGPAQPGGVPVEATTWDACFAVVSSVGFSGATGEAARESVQLKAGGLVRTDRTFDATTGALSKAAPVTTGWSFITNQPIATCDAVAAYTL